MKNDTLPLNPLATTEAILFKPNGLNEGQVRTVLGTMLAKGVDYADIYFQMTRSEAWSLEEGQVKSGSFSIDQGVGVRAISGERTAFAYSDEISPNALKDAAEAVRVIGHRGGRARVGKPVSAQAADQSVDQLDLYRQKDPLDSLKAADKVALLERIEAMARRSDPRVKQVMASLAGTYDFVLIARSDGALVADVRPLVRVSVTVTAKENNRQEMGHGGGGGRFDYTYFTDEKLEEYVNKAVHGALINLQARPAPAGVMPVVLGSGWPGILLHEAIGHGFEGDFNRKGSSAFAGRIGERVAAPGVHVVDDGTLANRRGSLNIDDEGNATQCTVLIEDGILRGYMQDSLNARLMKMPLTGNARRESYACMPLPRMTNTYMWNGDKTPEEIIASVKHGLYAVDFGGGQVDITNGKFVFSASEAYMIENGRITYPVKGVTLIGSGPDVLQRVSMIGNDMRLDSGVGVCGKEGQWVPVGVGQPTLKIDSLTVGGTS